MPIYIPEFDKSLFKGEGDRVGFKCYNNMPDIVIFEGWFVGL